MDNMGGNSSLPSPRSNFVVGLARSKSDGSSLARQSQDWHAAASRASCRSTRRSSRSSRVGPWPQVCTALEPGHSGVPATRSSWSTAFAASSPASSSSRLVSRASLRPKERSTGPSCRCHVLSRSLLSRRSASNSERPLPFQSSMSEPAMRGGPMFIKGRVAAATDKPFCRDVCSYGARAMPGVPRLGEAGDVVQCSVGVH